MRNHENRTVICGYVTAACTIDLDSNKSVGVDVMYTAEVPLCSKSTESTIASSVKYCEYIATTKYGHGSGNYYQNFALNRNS